VVVEDEGEGLACAGTERRMIMMRRR